MEGVGVCVCVCVGVTYGGVFAQLAKWWEGFLVSFADFVDQLLKLST